MENRNLLEVFGKNQSVRIEGSSVFFTKKGQERIIPIANITSVSIQPPFAWENSRILVYTPQRFGGLVAFALQTEDELPYAKNIQKYIAEFQANPNTSNVATTTNFSVADELIKLKALVDDGILTQEEFDKKKSKLLGD